MRVVVFEGSEKMEVIVEKFGDVCKCGHYESEHGSENLPDGYIEPCYVKGCTCKDFMSNKCK